MEVAYSRRKMPRSSGKRSSSGCALLRGVGVRVGVRVRVRVRVGVRVGVGVGAGVGVGSPAAARR